MAGAWGQSDITAKQISQAQARRREGLRLFRLGMFLQKITGEVESGDDVFYRRGVCVARRGVGAQERRQGEEAGGVRFSQAGGDGASGARGDPGEVVGCAAEGAGVQRQPVTHFAQKFQLPADKVGEPRGGVFPFFCFGGGGEDLLQAVVDARAGVSFRQEAAECGGGHGGGEGEFGAHQSGGAGAAAFESPVAEVFRQAGAPSEVEAVAGLQGRAEAAGASAAGESEMASVGAGEHLDNRAGLAVRTQGKENAGVVPLHGEGGGFNYCLTRTAICAILAPS